VAHTSHVLVTRTFLSKSSTSANDRAVHESKKRLTDRVGTHVGLTVVVNGNVETFTSGSVTGVIGTFVVVITRLGSVDTSLRNSGVASVHGAGQSIITSDWGVDTSSVDTVVIGTDIAIVTVHIHSFALSRSRVTSVEDTRIIRTLDFLIVADTVFTVVIGTGIIVVTVFGSGETANERVTAGWGTGIGGVA